MSSAACSHNSSRSAAGRARNPARASRAASMAASTSSGPAFAFHRRRLLHQMSRLANGLRVISSNMPHARSVSAAFFVRVGSRNEPFAIQGVSHFIEHMLFKGTTNRSAEEIARSVDSIGGNLDAFTAKELVAFARAFDLPVTWFFLLPGSDFDSGRHDGPRVWNVGAFSLTPAFRPVRTEHYRDESRFNGF